MHTSGLYFMKHEYLNEGCLICGLSRNKLLLSGCKKIIYLTTQTTYFLFNQIQYWNIPWCLITRHQLIMLNRNVCLFICSRKKCSHLFPLNLSLLAYESHNSNWLGDGGHKMPHNRKNSFKWGQKFRKTLKTYSLL